MARSTVATRGSPRPARRARGRAARGPGATRLSTGSPPPVPRGPGGASALGAGDLLLRPPARASLRD
eukprot:15100114-Alexandrium_andersonii.AAC.1